MSMKAKSKSTYTALSQGKNKSIDFHWMSHNRGYSSSYFPYKDMEVMKKNSNSSLGYGARGLQRQCGKTVNFLSPAALHTGVLA